KEGWGIFFPETLFWSEVRYNRHVLPKVERVLPKYPDLSEFLMVFYDERRQLDAYLTKTDRKVLEQTHLLLPKIKFAELRSMLTDKSNSKKWWASLRLKKLWEGGTFHPRGKKNHPRLGLELYIYLFPSDYKLTNLEQSYCTSLQSFRGVHVAFLTMPQNSFWWDNKPKDHQAYLITRQERYLNLSERLSRRTGDQWPKLVPNFNAETDAQIQVLDYSDTQRSFQPIDLKILHELTRGFRISDFIARAVDTSRRPTVSERMKYLEQERFFYLVPVFYGLGCPINYRLIAVSKEGIQVLQTVAANCPVAVLYQGLRESDYNPILFAQVRIPQNWHEAFKKVLRDLSRILTAKFFQYSLVSPQSSHSFEPNLYGLWDRNTRKWYGE
ncbi:MAG: hypothetical protein ACFFBD_27480, partial [Candidatus Hodarchaeota archaeon]